MYLFHTLRSQLFSKTLKLRCRRSDGHSFHGSSEGHDGHRSKKMHFVTFCNVNPIE
jgi:hypothetical protein